MEEWKSKIYTRVTKSNVEVEAPDNFDEWLEERINFMKESGLPLISGDSKEWFYEYYRDGKTLQQIADEHSVTRENVRQRKERVIKNLIKVNKYLTPIEWYYKNGNVFDVPMSQRAMTCIYQNNITTMKQLDQMLSDGSLLKKRNVGKVTISELMKVMTDWKIMQERDVADGN